MSLARMTYSFQVQYIPSVAMHCHSSQGERLVLSHVRVELTLISFPTTQLTL